MNEFYTAYRGEIDLLRTEIKYLNDKFHENGVHLARLDVMVDTLRKNVHTIKGSQQILNSTNIELENKFNSFDTKFSFTKDKIIEDLTKINDAIGATTQNINQLNEKITKLEQSPKFKSWLINGMANNYKLLGIGILTIGFIAITLYDLKKFFPPLP